jgi:NAD(P)-dependent dehydrogenase (short-subunit alcohol dehydrogenase family)
VPLDPLQSFRLDGQVAIVTGASSGLGARFARVLDAVGAKVVVAARREERLVELAGELSDALVVPCDVTDPEDRAALLAATVERFGRVDVLVNNAGVTNVAPATEESDEDFAWVMEVNVNAVFAMARDVGGWMIANGVRGRIVNSASIAGFRGMGRIPGAAYASSKAAVINLTRELATQWARAGVRVNAIAPGWFPSEMSAPMFTGEKGLAYIERTTPLGRAGEEHELDGALLYLASEASSYVTGHTLPVDGGTIAG